MKSQRHCEMDLLLATEDAEVLSSHGSCFRTAGKRKRGSRAIHSSLERVKQFRKIDINTDKYYLITVKILDKALIRAQTNARERKLAAQNNIQSTTIKLAACFNWLFLPSQ